MYAAHRERMDRLWPANVITPPTRMPRPPISPQQFAEAWEILDGKRVDLEGLNQSERIIKSVAHYYGMIVSDLISHRRSADVSMARHVAMYLARHTTKMTASMFGRLLGDRDHTTILHGIKKIETALITDKILASEIADLKKMLGA